MQVTTLRILLLFLPRGDIILATCFSSVHENVPTAKTALVIGTPDAIPYTQSQIESFLTFNFTIIGTDVYEPTTDFTALVVKWKALNPDILLGGGVYDSNLIAKAVRLANWNPLFIFIVGQITNAQPALNYVFTYSYWTPTLPYSDPYFGTSGEVAAAVNKFNNNTITNTNTQVIAALLAVYLAINETQSLDPTVIRDYILIANISTVYGKLTFDDTNSYSGPSLCCQYINETFTVVAPSYLKSENPIFHVIPVLPPDCYPPSNDRTAFLLAVILGTVIPGLCIIGTIILIIYMLLHKFDLILLPKQYTTQNPDFY